jgi:hypothetical protein
MFRALLNNLQTINNSPFEILPGQVRLKDCGLNLALGVSAAPVEPLLV